MARDYKYQLTSFCLKHGRLSLPYAMRALFPQSGEVTVLDSKRAETFTVQVEAGRYVTGVDTFLKVHQLEVNDAIVIRLHDDDSLSFTPLPATQRFTSRKSSVESALSELAKQQLPLSEAELRQLHNLPKSANLKQALSNDERFELVNGRWQLKKPPTQHSEKLPERPTAETKPEAAPAPKKPAKAPRVRVTPYPAGVIFPGDAGLNSQQPEPDISLQSRYRNLLVQLGYRVDSLGQGQLVAHAELGRRHYNALIHILPERGQLDWAQLMARRRALGTSYLAIFGHAQDLVPLATPTELAHASLWAVHGLERLEALLAAVPLSPVELEPFFARDGLFEAGLARFEALVDARVKARGTFSEVLARLATLRAPSVFVLDDIADASLSREQVLGVLELLMQAPFHLVSKVDSGEYCLHLRVADALINLSEYAISLRQRLPQQRRERLSGLDELAPISGDEAS